MVTVGPRRPNRSKQGTEWARAVRRLGVPVVYGREAQLSVPAGYLGTPKAEVPQGNQAGRGVAWGHLIFLGASQSG
jgi:hypothetical protein